MTRRPPVRSGPPAPRRARSRGRRPGAHRATGSSSTRQRRQNATIRFPLADADERHVPGHHSLEDVVVVPDVHVRRVRERAKRIGMRAVAVEDAGELAHAPGQRPEEQRVHDGQDRRVRANPQRQHEDGDRSEPGSATKQADGVPEVLHDPGKTSGRERRFGNRKGTSGVCTNGKRGRVEFYV